MTRTKGSMSIRKAVAYAAAGVGTLCVVYAVLVIAAVVPWPFACLTETKMKIANLSGIAVEVTYTNCDVIGKTEFVSVYASPAIGRGEPLFSRMLNRRTLIFRYDPGKTEDLLPSMKAAGDNRIIISNPDVSSIFYQSRKWKTVTIDYEIGHIDYP
jgi:hypothetical protein